MNDFWIVTLFHLQPTAEERQLIDSLALEELNALGIEEFSLSEAEVDDLLGERSYSGGDLPQEVLDEVEESVLSRPTNYRYFFSEQSEAEVFLQAVRERLLCEAQLEKKEDQDWNAEWKKHYAPIEVNEQLTIVPSWQREAAVNSKHRISINPGMGFGTGSHETTFLCLKLFTENILGSEIETILDFGSGSGILGLSALIFYPEARADFYDIDPEANKNCYENALLNGLAERAFRLLLPEVRDKLLPQYDLVFANILENILAEEVDSLTGMTAPGGALVLSGLLRHQSSAIIQMYSKHLTFVTELTRGDWSALLFQRKA